MPIDFDELMEEGEEIVLNPRDIFLTLPKSEEFSFLRDVQTEVLEEWFRNRDRKDTVIKLNVGSGKTVVGLLALQSSLNEGISPAVFVTPDKLLTDQVMEEASKLGIEVTQNENDAGFRSGKKILVINAHKLFNGRSVFGIGAQGERIEIGSMLIDDVHACLVWIRDQFRITLPNTHAAYAEIRDLFRDSLKEQNRPAFLGIEDGDYQKYIEVPFWNWQKKTDEILEILHAHKETEELLFKYDLIAEVLPYCRCVIGGRELEIAPICLPTDIVRSFDSAKRRIYMTATLADDSVLVTDFGARPEDLNPPITPSSAQGMGERMILMPQELNPGLVFDDMKGLLADLSEEHNVVVIVPSKRASKKWEDVADQILHGDKVADGVQRLRKKHVGLTVLINRYDGIDLPKAACRVLAIFDLPEVSSLIERADMSVLGETKVGLRHQLQRIEQGMGRGIRSNEDYCVVFLFGSKLTQRLLSQQGKDLLTKATQAQLDLSQKLATQMIGATTEQLEEAANHCLNRNKKWITASRKALLSASKPDGIRFDEVQLAVREAFDLARYNEHPAAAEKLQAAANATDDKSLQAWTTIRLAEVTNFYDRAEAQRITNSANKMNRSVVRPVKGIAYEKIAPVNAGQASAVSHFFLTKFLGAPERLLYVRSVVDDLRFEKGTSEKFEKAIQDVGKMLGIVSQRPESEFREGPDNLWALQDQQFFVIECKNGSTSEKGISKGELGQLDQSMTWFHNRYGQNANGVPIIIHPHRTLDQGANALPGLRVIEEKKLSLLKKNLVEFVTAISDEGVLHDVKKVRDNLVQFELSENKFLQKYSKLVKG